MENLKQFCISKNINKEKIEKILMLYEFIILQEPKKWTMRKLLTDLSIEYIGFKCAEHTLLKLVEFLYENGFIEALQHERYTGYFLKAIKQ